jgi:hypothetical protein
VRKKENAEAEARRIGFDSIYLYTHEKMTENLVIYLRIEYVSDPRATHLWDQKRLASRAFAGEVEGAAPPVWDAYLLYGPEVTWDDEPPQPISSGYTVYGAREELEKNILPLLERGS